MGRYIAVECDDGICRIHDEQTGDFGRVSFAGPQAFDMATGYARMANHQEQKLIDKMDKWFEMEEQ